MRLRPMPVVMISTLTERGAEVTMKALELGAIDFVAKPRVGLASGLNDLAGADRRQNSYRRRGSCAQGRCSRYPGCCCSVASRGASVTSASPGGLLGAFQPRN